MNSEQAYEEDFRKRVRELIHDPAPRCLKLVGYFQNYPFCADDLKKFWTPNLLARIPLTNHNNNNNNVGLASNGNISVTVEDNNLSIYLRCLPDHYMFNSVKFYQTLLSRIHYDKIWLFLAPECSVHAVTSADSSQADGMVAKVIRMLMDEYHARR
jgi:hypothetical protein